MKLILTSPDIILNTDKNSKKSVIDNLMLLDEDKFEILFVSSDKRKLNAISSYFQTLNVTPKVKQGHTLIEAIIEQSDDYSKYKDIIVIAGNNGDCFMAFNNKLLLISARWVKKNSKNQKVFNYGIGLRTPTAIKLISKQFLEMENNPWYYKLKVDDKTTMYSLINANTFRLSDSDDEKKIINIFQSHLKDGDATHRKHLIAYFLVSSYYSLKLRNVDYFAIYPSSGQTANEDLEIFKDKLRQQYKSRYSDDLLIRANPSIKRHKQGKASRIQNGCDSQLDTIIVNPKLKGALQGKVICILDDFTTYGTSCETTRHLLEEAGVKKIIFITLGKFGREYYKYDYDLTGSVHDNFTYTRLASSPEQQYGKFNNQANIEMLKSLDYLVS